MYLKIAYNNIIYIVTIYFHKFFTSQYINKKPDLSYREILRYLGQTVIINNCVIIQAFIL